MTRRPYYGWGVVAAAFGRMFVGFGAAYSFAAFFGAFLAGFLAPPFALADLFFPGPFFVFAIDLLLPQSTNKRMTNTASI